MKRVRDWLNAYIDALLGERSASATAGEAQSDDEALLMRTARELKGRSGKEGIEPRPEFVASLEKDLREELARSRPQVQRVPFWRLSWGRALAGAAAAAAVVMAFFWLRTGPMLPAAPFAAPAAAPVRVAEAPVPSPAPKAAPAAPAAAPRAPSRTLPELVAEAQTILLGQVVEVSAPPQAFGEGPPGPYDVRVIISVERYLKGSLPDNRVTLRASSSPALGGAFSPGERVLVMAGEVKGDGVLEVLGYPQARYTITSEGQAVAGAPGAKGLEGEGLLTLEELLSRIEGLLRGKP